MGNNTNTWSESDIQYLKENYGKLKVKDISSNINRTPNAIRQRADILQINKINYKNWTSDEINLLKENYSFSTKLQMQKIFPDRRWLHIKKKANNIGLTRMQRHIDQIIGSCKPLLENSPIIFYWIGFLLADGHFSKENRLLLTLAQKDRNHLYKIASIIGCNVLGGVNFAKNGNQHRYNHIAILDSLNVKLIKEKFNIFNDKTYNPPDFEKYNRFDINLLISLIIGFIDGDGCISNRKFLENNVTIRIKCHSTWLKFFNWIKDVFNKFTNISDNSSAKINNQGYAYIFLAIND